MLQPRHPAQAPHLACTGLASTSPGAGRHRPAGQHPQRRRHPRITQRLHQRQRPGQPRRHHREPRAAAPHPAPAATPPRHPSTAAAAASPGQHLPDRSASTARSPLRGRPRTTTTGHRAPPAPARTPRPAPRPPARPGPPPATSPAAPPRPGSATGTQVTRYRQPADHRPVPLPPPPRRQRRQHLTQPLPVRPPPARSASPCTSPPSTAAQNRASAADPAPSPPASAGTAASRPVPLVLERVRRQVHPLPAAQHRAQSTADPAHVHLGQRGQEPGRAAVVAAQRPGHHRRRVRGPRRPPGSR